MKYKKIIFGLGATLSTIAPIATVISCGSDKESHVNNVASLANFDELIVNHGESRDEAINHEKEIIKLEDQIKTGKVDGFIFNGKTYLLKDFKKESSNAVQEAINALNLELGKYYPSTLEGSLGGLASTGKIVFETTKFNLPNPGSQFNIQDKLPIAPKHTSWVASSDLFLGEGPHEERWWPINGWKRPYTNIDNEITFKVKLVPEIGYKIIDNNLTTLTFRKTEASASIDQITSTIKAVMGVDSVSHKTTLTFSQREGIFEEFKVKFNGADSYTINNDKLNEPINIDLQKVANLKYPDNQDWHFVLTPSEFISTQTLRSARADYVDVPVAAELSIGDKNYYYYKSGATLSDPIEKSPFMKSETEFKTFLKTLPTANHEITIKAKEKGPTQFFDIGNGARMPYNPMVDIDITAKIDSNDHVVLSKPGPNPGDAAVAITWAKLLELAKTPDGIQLYVGSDDFDASSSDISKQVYELDKNAAIYYPARVRVSAAQEGFYTTKTLGPATIDSAKVADGVITQEIYLTQDTHKLTIDPLLAKVVIEDLVIHVKN